MSRNDDQRYQRRYQPAPSNNRPPVATVSSTVDRNRPRVEPMQSSMYDGVLKSDRKCLPISPLFFAILPGLMSFAVMVSAVSLVAWRNEVPLGSIGNTVTAYGLFQVCRKETSGVVVSCQSAQDFANTGGALDDENNDLEQATKGMMIVAILVSVGAIATSVLLGLNRFRRSRGFLFCAGVHAFTGVCVMSAMICYTILLDNLQELTPSGTLLYADHSYFMGWFATAMSYLAAVMSLTTGFLKK